MYSFINNLIMVLFFFLNNKSREGNKSYELDIELFVCLFLQDQDLILYKKPKDL